MLSISKRVGVGKASAEQLKEVCIGSRGGQSQDMEVAMIASGPFAGKRLKLDKRLKRGSTDSICSWSEVRRVRKLLVGTSSS